VTPVDPLAGSSWSDPATVAGFAQSLPNATLMQRAQEELQRNARLKVIDIGCGAGRNALPLARLGCEMFGIDLSRPMVASLVQRVRDEPPPGVQVRVALAPMECIPFRSGSFDFVVAHGIWNLARSAAQFRRAVREAARVARPDAVLFVFTFSRNTLPADAEVVPGEPFVFTRFSGQPQCFLTEGQLVEELSSAAFVPDPRLPLSELNRTPPGSLLAQAGPVIYEGAFRLGS
jgi:2-polyprenyl-6-hydroxyphenyl methylase/3-demethylubiquinone-9 3-methyltransferase